LLLQVATVAQKPWPTPAAQSRVSCETCAHIAHAAGACKPQVSGKIRADPRLSGCDALDCEVELGERCAAGDRPPSCGTCAEVFRLFGLCDAVQSDDMEPLVRLEDPAFAGCGDQDCRTEIQVACLPQDAAEDGGEPGDSCEVCADAFAAAGGCGLEADSQKRGSLKFGACNVRACRPEVEAKCSQATPQPEEDVRDDEPAAGVKIPTDAGAACEACATAVVDSGACARLLAGAAPVKAIPGLPEQCHGVGPRCLERAAAGCREGTKDRCWTAQQGELCFRSVRWAMERGIAMHPEWYAGLTQQSSFEDFQQFMHDGRAHECSMPCPVVSRPCRTTVPGEECHRQVAWVFKNGLRSDPGAYPWALVQNATFEGVQQWLHQVHQAECATPCF